MQTNVQVSIALPPLEIDALDNLVEQKKKATGNKKYSRSMYVREALELYLKKEKHFEPNPLPKGDPKVVGRKPMVLLLDIESHLKPIAKIQEEFEVDQVQVIRQAVIERALEDGNQWVDWESIIVKPKPVPVEPMYEDLWLKAPAIYNSLGINRNTLRNKADKADARYRILKQFSSRTEREYNFADIIRALRLSKEEINKIVEAGKGETNS